MEVEILKLNHQGEGIAYVDNVVTFIPKCVPGDVVDIKITEKKKNFQRGELIKIITSSPKRIDSFCPFYFLCGGCSLQNLSYKESVLFKKEKVINIFSRNNIFVDPEVIENPVCLNYRNKISLKVRDKKVGFFKDGTNDLVAIDNCCIAKTALNKVIPFIKNWNLTEADITIRCNLNDEILIVISSSQNPTIDIESLKREVKLVGIILNRKTIYGENYLFERLNNVLYKISYDSFFQVNPHVASLLFKIVEDNLNPNETVLDLYCGVGALSLQVAKKVKKVLGIEIIPNAVLNAINNARINKLNNAYFVLNKVEDAIDKIKDEFNTWIIDPPRSGIDKKTMSVIKDKLPSKIIYVSCDPMTLSRDINILKDKYDISKFYVLDMFSYTYHVECVCLLKLRKPL